LALDHQAVGAADALDLPLDLAPRRPPLYQGLDSGRIEATKLSLECGDEFFVGNSRGDSYMLDCRL